MSDSSSGSSWLERLGKVFSDEPESREDLVDVLKEAQSQGVIDDDALVMIEGVLDVSELRARDIMIPRPQIELIDASEPLEKILESMLESSHSRYPVMEENKIVGVLLAKDVFRAVVKGELSSKEDLQAIYREPKFVPESKRLNVLLRDFKTSRNHLALVVDEYAELAGLITIEDVLEQIVGDIEDEHDEDELSNIQKRAGESYAVQAITPLDEFSEFFDVEIENESTETIGGFLAVQLGHVPRVEEEVEYENLYIKVLKASDRRVELLEVRPLDGVEAGEGMPVAG
ncbi:MULTISPECIES: HlyC/CorC family transporter [Thiomicrorhabdus]|uniref:Magnesium and cobalt efflux protein CorC n=1 Tax=Thiomicrorhabdus heinhorstiae TaxID=2748010 RepID=A0ABS0BZY6_9GAMM|nr:MULTISPECIES: transporter associated domain-containing protein [Thiomicrorhabdus]MBF6058610.1 CBS domain-containing protein [Thiomicrorhabdus heinhorstiae]